MITAQRTYLAGLALAASATLPVVASAAPMPQHLRGTISAVTATTLTISTANGPVSMGLAPDLKVAGVLPATAAAIVPGTFIGTANVPGTGAARALEVVVFPDAMRGTGEGDYAWDLPTGGHHSAMTNGTVAKPKTTSMTNATVSHVDAGATRTISVAYKGGTKKIAIPPDAPIVRLEPGSRALLVKGARVFVIASPGAKPVAMRVLAGERGTVPPM